MPRPPRLLLLLDVPTTRAKPSRISSKSSFRDHKTFFSHMQLHSSADFRSFQFHVGHSFWRKWKQCRFLGWLCRDGIKLRIMVAQSFRNFHLIAVEQVNKLKRVDHTFPQEMIVGDNEGGFRIF